MQVNFTINIDDRLVKGVKAFFKKRSVIITATILLITTLSLVYAQTTTDRIVFYSGQVIKASDLNYNFETLWASSGAGGSSVPVGTILPYVGTTLPDEELWLWCDGMAFDSSEFPELRLLLGHNNTPDLRGRVIAGKLKMNSTDGRDASNDPDGYKRLDNSFAQTMLGVSPADSDTNIMDWQTTLVEANIPPHRHKYFKAEIHESIGIDSNVTSNKEVDDGNGNMIPTQYSDNWAHTVVEEDTTEQTFDPTPFNIVQPTIIMNFIIKAKSKATTTEE